MSVNTTDLAALRAEIEELKQQRQELRQLNTYREVEAAGLKDELKEAKKDKAKVEQLSRVVDTMRVRELELKGEKQKIEADMRQLVEEKGRVDRENLEMTANLKATGNTHQTAIVELKKQVKKAEEKMDRLERNSRSKAGQNARISDLESEESDVPPFGKRKATSIVGLAKSASKKSKT
ncbi:hypothetical protein FA13DRAFT_1725447 [Coprinellus micaceus]|uniref:Uncharacterized protein n=1 Tax=Coprinellus micaceus TaxID=71717 RepID=A0A4Y7TV41_COPMI|nr:hypothetical protein FA13DRAFT_1725447 [Coprinellus micaceus]